MLLKIKNVLNNENGSPNVETLINISVSLGIIVGLYIFTAQVYKLINKMSLFVNNYAL